MKNTSLNLITKKIAKHFSFLLDRGFVISNSSGFFESLGSWFVEYESKDCFLLVFSDRSEVTITLYPVKADRRTQIALEPLIYHLTGGREFINNYGGNLTWDTKKQLERMASLLEEYIDRIILLFKNNFITYKDDLMLAGKKYVDLQLAGIYKKSGF